MELMELCTDHENEYLREHGGVLMPKLVETLEVLSQKYFLAIVSNCQQGYIEAFLAYHDLERFFDDHEDFGTTQMQKSDNISLVMERNGLEKTLYVGDIQGDCDSALKAGAAFVHAAYGYGKVPAAEYRINTFSELIDIADSFFEGTK